MKTFLKKILVVCSIIFALTIVTNLKPAGEAYAEVKPCGNFLGFTSWDCNTLKWQGEGSMSGEEAIKANVTIIAANILTDINILAAYLVIGFVIYGGYQYILASGDPGKVAAGKKTLIHAFIGLGIVLLSSIILNTLRVAFMGQGGSFDSCATTDCTTQTDIVSNAINWVIGIGGVVALIFVFIGGIGYMTSAGDPNKLQKAKHTITYALIGLILVGLSLGITAFVTSLINNSKGQDNSLGYTKEITKEQYEIQG